MVPVNVAVVAGAGFDVYRPHGRSGVHNIASAPIGIWHQIIPSIFKDVFPEDHGARRIVATIIHLDINAQPQQVLDATLPPWSTITTTEPAVVGKVVTQGNNDSIGCRITVSGETKNKRSVREMKCLHLLLGG